MQYEAMPVTRNTRVADSAGKDADRIRTYPLASCGGSAVSSSTRNNPSAALAIDEPKTWVVIDYDARTALQRRFSPT